MAQRKITTDQSVIQNAFSTVLANIRFASVDNEIKTIAVTSSVPNEGKSTVAIGLAQAMAQSGKRTLLVDCDMRRRSLASRLNLHGKGGIYAVLSGKMQAQDAIMLRQPDGFYFLDCEPHIANPSDLLSSKRFKSLVEMLRNSFDYVVFDAPPVGTFVDAAEIASHTDGTIVVVRENFVKKADVREAIAQLNKAQNVNIIGCVANCCESDSSDYYYSYYTKGESQRGGAGQGPRVQNAPAQGAENVYKAQSSIATRVRTSKHASQNDGAR